VETAGVRRLFRFGLCSWLCAASACLAAVGCEKTAETPGQIVVTFQTDMAMPDQIDNVLVLVTRHGRVDYMNPYRVGPADDEYRVPGTLTLVAAKALADPVTVTVAGSRAGVWRTFREVITTIPDGRVAELRMPVQWLCNESAMPQYVSTADGMGGVVNHVLSNCDDGTTCKAGSCQPNSVDGAKLPLYQPENVFGGAAEPKDGQCFETVECLSAGAPVMPDSTDCTIAKPDAEDGHINVGLRVADGGICDASSGMSTTCFVPLDGNDAEGWTLSADGVRVQLPPAVCERIADRTVLAVYTSSVCPTKTTRLPPCGAWSSVPTGHAVQPAPPAAPDSGADASADANSWPSAELVTSLVPPGSTLCCPLMSDQTKLYTCTCPKGDTAHATVVSLDPDHLSPKSTTFDRPPSLAAVVHQDTLYWAEDKQIAHVAMTANSALASTFSTPGTLYTDGVMLADADGVYALATGVGTAAPVLLLHVGYDGALNAQDPLGNRVVKQFAQDDRAFYAGLNFDQLVPDGQPFQRISSVVRIDKISHARSTVLKEQILTISDPHYNGYLGVVSDGSSLFAEFESVAGADGNEHLQIIRVDAASGAAAADPVPLYDLPTSPNHYTVLQLLGAVDGAVLFARYELEPDAQKTLRSSSVLVIPAGSNSAHFIADFAGDSPAPGIGANAGRIFWLNQSGRLFGFDRKALRTAP
jgi:hypothetical protein